MASIYGRGLRVSLRERTPIHSRRVEPLTFLQRVSAGFMDLQAFPPPVNDDGRFASEVPGRGHRQQRRHRALRSVQRAEGPRVL